MQALDAEALESNLKRLLGEERNTLVSFLLHLAELDRRRLFELKGYASLWQYCRQELGLSESQAFYRFRAARMIRRFPVLAAYIEDGRICLSAVAPLREVLTPDNVVQVLDRVVGKTRDEIRLLVAELAPRPSPEATIVRALPALSAAPQPDPSASALASTPPVIASDSSVAPASAAPAPAPRWIPSLEAVPKSAEQFRIHFTADKEFMDKLERARNALSHSVPDGDLRRVIERGLDAILAMDAKKHDPSAVKPRPYALKSATKSDRYIPAELIRQVWARDNRCCSWKTAKGVCGSKRCLEIDHIVPIARGGKTELSNLRLVCREHNQMAARQVFGTTFIDSKIQERREDSAATSPEIENEASSAIEQALGPRRTALF